MNARRSPHEVLSVLEVDLQYLQGGGGVVEEEFRLIKKKYHKVSLDVLCEVSHGVFREHGRFLTNSFLL